MSDLPCPTKSLSSVTFSYKDTFKPHTSLDPPKGMGGDSIPPNVIKHCAVALLEPVHHLLLHNVWINLNLPNEWKKHNIIPIPKPRTPHLSKTTVPSLCSVVSQKCSRDKYLIKYMVLHLSILSPTTSLASGGIGQLLNNFRYIPNTFNPPWIGIIR